MFSDVRNALGQHASNEPDATLYTFLVNRDDKEVRLTRAEADHFARSFASGLRELNLEGERILICLPSGLEYVISVLGCLYAGAIAVPALPPARDSEWQRIDRIKRDCNPRAVIA